MPNATKCFIIHLSNKTNNIGKIFYNGFILSEQEIRILVLFVYSNEWHNNISVCMACKIKSQISTLNGVFSIYYCIFYYLDLN